MSKFSIIPANCLFDKRLTHHNRYILSLIAMHSDRDGVCWVSNSKIAKFLGIDRTAVSKQIKILKDCGYLMSVPTKRADGGQSVNMYTVIYDHKLIREYDADPDFVFHKRNYNYYEQTMEINDPPRDSIQSPPLCRSSGTPPLPQLRHPNKRTNINESLLNDNVRSSSKTHFELTNSDIPNDEEQTTRKKRQKVNGLVYFPIFWNAYDKKVGKKACEDYWLRHGLDKEIDILLENLKTRKELGYYQDKQFVCDPIRYLKRKAWNDELIDRRKKSSADDDSDIQKYV